MPKEKGLHYAFRCAFGVFAISAFLFAITEAQATPDKGDFEFFFPKQYGCTDVRPIIIISGKVHEQLHHMLSGSDQGMSPNEFMTFYDRVMGLPSQDGVTYGPQTKTMLDLLSSCGIHITS